MDNIFEEACRNLQDNSIITGGHFRIFFEKDIQAISLNIGTVLSFEYAVKLYLHAVSKNTKADFGILINDMGSSCDENGCHLKTSSFIRMDYPLPEEYIKILSQNGIKDYPVKIYWEKHIRNQGKKELLKLLKKGSDPNMNPCSKSIPCIIKEKNALFLNDPQGYGKIILTRTQGKDKYGTPACTLIMSGFSIEQSKPYDSAVNFYYIGGDNITNIPNYFAIEKGKRICELIGYKLNINNLYFD
jgi:hypothetical protein